MADLEFTDEEIFEQARGDSSAIWRLAARWARERDGSVDGWGSFVGRAFAPTWDEVGEHASALDVARQTALIMASQADCRRDDAGLHLVFRLADVGENESRTVSGAPGRMPRPRSSVDRAAAF